MGVDSKEKQISNQRSGWNEKGCDYEYSSRSSLHQQFELQNKREDEFLQTPCFGYIKRLSLMIDRY